jgi:hypothetical protein
MPDLDEWNAEIRETYVKAVGPNTVLDRSTPAKLEAIGKYLRSRQIPIVDVRDYRLLIAQLFAFMEVGNVHPDGDSKYSYCNAAENHVRANSDHVVTVQHKLLDNGDMVLEVACSTTDDEEPWWDHIA